MFDIWGLSGAWCLPANREASRSNPQPPEKHQPSKFQAERLDVLIFGASLELGVCRRIEKNQDPRSNLQRNINPPSSNPNGLMFDIWGFSGAWCLELGVAGLRV
jgi:hypothetical protein